MRKKIDLTVAITTHTEGLILHKTMMSIFEALDRVEESGYGYEIVIHVDNGDNATINYLDRYKSDKRIRIFQNSFGDTGSSRNFAANKARGDMIAFMDGDDLISPNWFLEALKLVKKSKKDIIVHPEAILTFGMDQPNILTIQRNSRLPKEEATILASGNLWCSVSLARRSVFISTPYRRLGIGYGHEDWIFNIDTIQKNIPHRIAGNTVLFYRRSENSRLSSGNNDGVVIPAMDLFDLKQMATVPTPEMDERLNRAEAEQDEDQVKKKWTARRVYKGIRNNKYLNFFITPVAKFMLWTMGRLPKDDSQIGSFKTIVPDWVIKEWVAANHIEPLLYPYKQLLIDATLYEADAQSLIGEAFCRLAKMVKKKPDYVFIVPWVVRGGADKVLFNYIEALKEKHPEWHFAVISTLPVKNTWADKLPDCVDFIDYGNVAAELWSDEARDELMSRLIVQLQCNKLHIINSDFGYLWIKKHKKLIEAEYRLDVSIFAWGYIEGSNFEAVESYANPRLFDIYSAVRYIFTDNQNMKDYLIDVNAFDEKKIKVLYQPIKDMEVVSPHEELVEEGKIKILWAGRVTSVKMPELVAEIGKRLDENKVTISVYGEIDKTVNKDIFDDIPALKYYGVYNGFESLPISEYDLLLYTSLSDGMPNVVLEAAAAGIPILASNDGGVGEFVQNEKTGILVEDYKNPKEYIERINEISKNPKKLSKLAKSAQRLLNKRHSWQAFLDIIID